MILDQGEELVIISNTKVKVLIAISYLTLCDPWTIVRQALLSIEFSRQEYWGGLPFPSLWIFQTQG